MPHLLQLGRNPLQFERGPDREEEKLGQDEYSTSRSPRISGISIMSSLGIFSVGD
jgi:hypothetical protein